MAKKFIFESVVPGLSAMTQRAAVVIPLSMYGRCDAQADMLAKRYPTVEKMWRNWVESASGRKGEEYRRGSARIKMHECSPAAVNLTEFGYTCDRHRICPWCYCRRVVLKVFQAAQFAVRYLDFLEREHEKGQYCFTHFCTKYSFSRSQAGFTRMVHETRNMLQPFRDSYTIEGAIRLSQLRPLSNDQWLLSANLLAVMPKTEMIHDDHREFVVRRVTAPNGKQLKTLVAGFTSYPVSLLNVKYLSGVISYLKEMDHSRPHLMQSTGLLRNKTFREAYPSIRSNASRRSTDIPHDFPG